MPPMERSDLRHYAVLWARAGYDRYSEPTLQAPVEIRCRWVENIRVVKDPQGNTITLTATVVVAQDVPDHSVMWRGRLADLDVAGAPPEGSTLVTVEAFNKTDDVKARESRRSVDVSTYSGTLPAAA